MCDTCAELTEANRLLELKVQNLMVSAEIDQKDRERFRVQLELARRLAEAVKKELAHEFYIQSVQQALRDFNDAID